MSLAGQSWVRCNFITLPKTTFKTNELPISRVFILFLVVYGSLRTSETLKRNHKQGKTTVLHFQ